MSDSNNEDIRVELGEIRQAVNKMADALTRLARLEEKHTNIHDLLRRLMDRQDEEERKRHEQEIEAARAADIPQRVLNLEHAIRDMHIESAKEKAALAAYQRSAKLFWGAITFISSSGLLLGAVQLYLRTQGA